MPTGSCYGVCMAIGATLSKFFLGEKGSDVEIDPQLSESQRRLKRLSAAAEATALGTEPTPGEIAAERAGEAATQRLESAAAAQAAGVRGPGALFAQRSAQRNIAQGAQDIAGQTARVRSLAGIQERAAASTNLERLAEAELQLAERERIQREERRRKGFLGVAGAVGGGIIGGLTKGPGGISTGATLGSALGRSFERQAA